jgi:chemotaxis protein methyltransferase CheR
MISDKEFNYLRELIYASSGIKLNENKKALVAARLGKRLRKLDLPDIKAYISHLKDGKNTEELIELLDAISTNFTHFFREKEHFNILRTFISQFRDRGQTKFRIWSCASSSGEEPYSLALTMYKELPANFDIKILATDISREMLAKCKNGRYEKSKLTAVDKQDVSKYFTKTSVENVLEAGADLKKILTFAWINLSKPPFVMNGPFDAVFCRNVMIYFDQPVRQRLISEIYRLLRPQGLFVVGHSESLTGLQHSFKTISPSVYVKE